MTAELIPRPLCLMCGQPHGIERDARGVIAHWRGRAKMAEGAAKGTPQWARRWKAAAAWFREQLQTDRKLVDRLSAELEAVAAELEATQEAQAQAHHRAESLAVSDERARGNRRAARMRSALDDRRRLVLALVAMVREARAAAAAGNYSTSDARHAAAALALAWASDAACICRHCADVGNATGARRAELQAQEHTHRIRSLCAAQARATAEATHEERERWRVMFAHLAATAEKVEGDCRLYCRPFPLRPWEPPPPVPTLNHDQPDDQPSKTLNGQPQPTETRPCQP